MSAEQAPTSSETSKYMIVERAITLNDQNEILLLQRVDEERYNAGLWEPPGGKQTPTDWAMSAIDREALEEAGIRAIPLTLLVSPFKRYVTEGRYAGTAYLELVTIARYVGGIVQFNKEEHQAAGWFKFEEALKLPITLECRAALTAWHSELARLGAAPPLSATT